MSKTTTKKWAIGTLFAAIIGYLAGLLTAPQSGKKTRADVKKVAEQTMIEAEKQLKKLHTQITEVITQGKEKVVTLQGAARKELQIAIDKAMAAKEKARELLSALHEGGAEDKELQKAISEATEAIDHLKIFLTK
jgi:gas vesicle protein